MGLLLVVGAGIGIAWQAGVFQAEEVHADTPKRAPQTTVASGVEDAIDIEPALIESMHIEFTAAKSSIGMLPLKLTGQLMIDPARLVHVQSRFSGEVIAVGEHIAPTAVETLPAETKSRVLQTGDRVRRGQLLAVIWSREVGEKKSDLADALSNLWLHESLLKKLRNAGEGTVPQRTIDEMLRTYESDLISVTRLRRTLRSWRIDDHELAEIEQEAKRIHEAAQNMKTPAEAEDKNVASRDHRWAEMDIYAPRDGILLEMNFTVGDLVDTTNDLFKIADLGRLRVMANVYEDDLPRLLQLPARERRWKVRFPNQTDCPDCFGEIETIGHVIDPNQHTAVVTGWVENPGETLRVGQFARAVIDMPTAAESISVPLSAIIDQGEQAAVLVVMDDQAVRVQRRWVTIVRRTPTEVWIAPTVTAPSTVPITVGERVVTSGAIELHAKLAELLAAHALKTRTASAEEPGR